MASNKIIVIGSSNTDMVVQAPQLPAPGETVLGGTFMMNNGGKGANQAVAVHRLGGNLTFVARVGNDMFGRQTLQSLASEGIDTSYISVDDKTPSGVALIAIDFQAENSIVVAPGANKELSPADVDRAAHLLNPETIVLMQLETPLATIAHAARLAREKGARVVLNPAPAQQLPPEFLHGIYMLTPNRGEAEKLSGVKIVSDADIHEAAMRLIAMGVEKVVITLGSRGSYVLDGPDNGFFVPSQKVQPVDTTAAGDTFNGALCVALSEGQTLEQAVRMASAAAAIAVTRHGAQPSIPHRAEIDF